MTDSDSADFSVVAANERSLQTLVRSLTLSHGQFALILVRCNYTALQEQLLRSLRERCPVQINELVLPSSATTLYDTILATLNSQPSPALMVLGLESVQSLDDLLIATNQLRDRFRSSFAFPVVLWVNDEVLQKLTRFALDLKTFAASPIKFEFTTANLINLLQQEADFLFNKVLETRGTQQFPNTAFDLAVNSRHRRELEFALRDLQLRHGVTLEPELEASTSFVLGCDAYTKDQIDNALTYYHRGLALWQRTGERGKGNGLGDPKSQIPNLGLRAAVLLFHMGLCYYRNAELHPSENQSYWEEARHYFQQCVELFEQTQRSDLIAKFITPFLEVLRRLEAWEELFLLAQKSLALHQTYGTQTQLAQDYGFLASVALERSNWAEAHRLADASLAVLEQVISQDGFNYFHEQHQSLGLFLLALSQRYLGQEQEALNNLEWARVICHVQYDPSLALKILAELRSLYFERHQYLKAFDRKQEQLQIERAYGFRAFIGAGQLQPHRYSVNPVQLQSAHQDTVAQEIAASGRQQDLNCLIERISRTDRKLTVVHGPSGVGKSSILKAGLVPALQQTVIGHRIALPIVVSRYTDWIKALRRALGEAIGDLVFGIGDFELGEGDPNQHETEKIKSKIQNLVESQNKMIILVFDQFEEFFFINPEAIQRREFALFLRECLNLPFIKVILSLREDYLHYLLECERLCRTSNEYTSGLAVINNNILDKDIRYYLGNFSSTDAFDIIQNLTQHSQYKPSPELIHALVQDLSGGVLGEVHPIELQIVGSQLQAERLTTIQQYQQYGPKEKLVERWLEQVIQDCGPENEQFGWKILFQLTDEDGTRPLRTKQDLATALPLGIARSQFRNATPHTKEPSPGQADLILEILVGSGLVLRSPEESGDRYQLVHDYVVKPIRARDTSGLKVQLQLSQEQLRQRNQVLKWLLNIAMIFALSSGLLAWRAESQKQRADESEAKAQIGALAAASEALFVSHKELDALLESLRAWKQLQQAKGFDAQTRTRVVTALQQAVYGVTETNRLEGHGDVVWGVNFSPDGQTIASASRDQTVKLWRNDGKELQTLHGHHDSVTSVTFSPDSQLIASASWDQTVKLWRKDKTKGGYTIDRTLQGHKGAVYGVSFSPDGQMIATGSQDQTVKLWRRDGRLIRTLQGHRGPVNWVSFSPDGQLVASASDDKTVKLWRQDGRLVQTLQGHRDWVTAVSFSRNGQLIASAGRDKTVNLWSRNHTGGFQTHPYKSLQQHGGTIWSVSFSPSGRELASASDDNTVKLWSLNGTLLRTFKGHNDSVTSVSFSPDNRLLASGSYDKSVKLWSLDSPKTPILQGHTDRVNSVRFSPDAQVLASASNDQTVKLWRRDGSGGFETHPYRSLVGHTARVTSVSFHPNGQILASASYDKTIKLWNLNGTLLKTLQGHSDGITSVSFSPDGQMLASASKDNTVKLWRNGTLIHTLLGHTKRVNSVQFSPDGQLIASASDDNTVKLWHSDGRLVRTLGGRGSQGWVVDVSFSPTGQLLASANWDNTVRLWSLDGRLVDTLLKGYSDSVNSVSFSRDGQVLAAASWDNTVKLWSLDGKLLKTLNGHRSAVLSASFAPQGQLLASASDDRTIMLWNLDLDNLLKRGCSWMHDYLQHNSNVKDSDRHLCDGVGGK